MTVYDVRPVRDRAALRDFMAAARRAEASNGQWVEQLHEETRRMLDPKSVFREQNAVEPFVAYRSGEPVGRIVATVDASHQRKYGDRCGFFGFIEAVEDPACFAALFGAAESFLRGRGMRLARGPFGLNINGESGLLVEGFEEAHIMLTNHCPRYYGPAVEALGYAKATDLLAFVCSVGESRTPEKVARAIARRALPDIDIRDARYRTILRDLRTLFDFYNDAWSENRWSLPMSRREADHVARLLLPVVKPGWISFASYRGELVSVVAQVPDVNEALRGLDGSLFPTGLPRFLWRLHGRGTRRARVMLAATAKRWRDTVVGIAAMGRLMAKSIVDARDAGVEEVEYSWILEDNRAAIAPVLALPARRTRVFRIFEKAL